MKTSLANNRCRSFGEFCHEKLSQCNHNPFPSILANSKEFQWTAADPQKSMRELRHPLSPMTARWQQSRQCASGGLSFRRKLTGWAPGQRRSHAEQAEIRPPQQRCTTCCSKRLTTRQHHNSTWHSARSFTQTCRKHQPSHMGEQNHALVCSPPTPPAHHSPCNVQCAQEHQQQPAKQRLARRTMSTHAAHCTACHLPLRGRQKESGAGGVPRPSTPSCAQC